LGGLPVYSTPANNTNTGVGVFGLFLYLVALPCSQRLFLRGTAISFIEIWFSDVPHSKAQRSSSLEILQYHCCIIPLSSDPWGCPHSDQPPEITITMATPYCSPHPRRRVAGARALVKYRTAATDSKRALLFAAGCVSAAFFASFFPPAR
jgi:hypothetical protein